MADWNLSDLDRKLRADPGELLYLTKYCSLLNRTSGLIVVDQYLTQHVKTYELSPLNKFKENYLQELLNLGLVPGAYTEATVTEVTTNFDLDHCVEIVIELLLEHSEAMSAAIGHDPHWIQKIDGNRVEHGYFSSEDTQEIAQNIQRYRQHFLFSPHQHQLLRATMRQFSHNLSAKKHAIFIPAWALEKLFSLEITRTSAGFSRSNRWYEATSKLTHFGHDWNKNQINKMRQALLGAIDDEISFKTLKFNGIFELDRYVDAYKAYRNET